ncbi:MAG: hypothetical protein JWO78_1481 [Micavibrio sp.]|nr:hypothetical protein [Micavibrio sp.]
MALLFTILLGLSAGVLGYFSYYFNHTHYIESAGSVLDTEIHYLKDNRADLPRELKGAERQHGRVYLLQDVYGRYIAGNLRSVPPQIKVMTEGTILFSDQGRDYAAKVHLFPGGDQLLAGMDITAAMKSYRLMQVLSLLSILFMAIVVMVSFVISTFVVSRTNRIAETARAIMETGDLSRRIVLDNRWDDLSNMASVLNNFLERIEQLMQGIRRVSDNIAHDLRTPLTRLLNQLEDLRDRADGMPGEDITVRSEAMIMETSRLLDTFNALLRITRIETGARRQDFESVDLRAIILDVIEFYEPLAEEKSISLSCEAVSIPLYGDRDLLFQAFANLLDNAIKFTPVNGVVAIKLCEVEGRPVFSIRDSGPGVSPKEREKVFDRFYRADSSRTTEGNGLGLSLVAAVVTLHGASIALKDASPGLIAEITFL